MYWTVHLEGGPRRVNHAAVKVGHHIYSFGGYNKHIDFEEQTPISVYNLNTANLRWREIKVNPNQTNSCPYQRYGHTAVEYGTDIIVWGGRNDIRACNKVFIFDTRNEEWRCPSVTGSSPLPRDGHSACVINDRMYIFGGFLDDYNEYCNDVYYLDLKTMHWSKVTISGNLRPPGRDFHSAAVIGSRMYIIGGRGHTSFSANAYFANEDKYWSNVFYFETKTNTWHKANLKGTIPIGRRSHSTFVFNGCIYMFGGCNGTLERHFNDMHRLNPETNEWHEMKPLGTAPCIRRRQSCIVVGDRAYVFGGSCPKPKNSDILNDLPPEFQQFLDQQQCTDLEDLDDLHVLELGTPNLRVLSCMKVIEEKLSTEMLPRQLQIEIKNMTTRNDIPAS